MESNRDMDDPYKNKLKLRLKFGKNKKHDTTPDPVFAPVDLPVAPLDPLRSLSQALVQREQLMMGPGLSEEDQDQLHIDLENLWLQIRIQVHKTFTVDFSAGCLRAAVDCILDQEDMDRRWQDFPSDLVPVWRPSRTLQNHNELLQLMIRSRLKLQPKDQLKPDQDQPKTQDQTKLSSSVKQEVCRLGRVVLEDLLFLSRSVVRSYPDHMDVLNLFLRLYHNTFRLHLQELADASLDQGDHAYLLMWTNHSYPQEVLLHPELKDKLSTAALGPLLSPGVLQRVQDQHMDTTQSRVRQWLANALQKEEGLWRSGPGSDVIDGFCFSPLALDVIQVIDGALEELSCVSPDQSRDRITAEIPGFLSRYLRSLEEFVEQNQRNVGSVLKAQQNAGSVLKAQLFCEEQLRDFVRSREMEEQQRQRCLDGLSALRDCGYCGLTSSIQSQLKPLLSGLWTEPWISGTLLVLDSLLEFISLELDQLHDLKPTCRQTVLRRLHQDVALRYIKNLLKSRRQSPEEQVGGANRMKADSHKLHTFFTQQGGGCEWMTQVLQQVSEVLRLQDPDLVQLELVSLVRTCPDLSVAHVSRLLLLKSGQSAASVRRIRRSVEENRPQPESTNQSPLFFSRIRTKWNLMELKRS